MRRYQNRDEKVIRQCLQRILHNSHAAAVTNDDRPIVGIISKTHKAHRMLTHADNLLFLLTPEISGFHSKSGSKRIFLFPEVICC